MSPYGLFQCSQQALLVRDEKVLILRFTGGRKLWGFPGGRIDEGELDRDAAFARELYEEIGMTEFKRLAVVDYSVFHAHSVGADMVAIGILIESSIEHIKLSHEHSEYAWVGIDDLEKYDFSWPHAKDMIYKAMKFSIGMPSVTETTI